MMMIPPRLRVDGSVAAAAVVVVADDDDVGLGLGLGYWGFGSKVPRRRVSLVSQVTPLRVTLDESDLFLRHRPSPSRPRRC